MVTPASQERICYVISSEAYHGISLPEILCPIDFDENSSNALEQASEIARHLNATVLLIHAVLLVTQFGEVPIPIDPYQEQQERRIGPVE